MASYYRRKNGTYCIRVSRGKPGGKQDLVSTTYKPPKGISASAAERGAKEFAELFEELGCVRAYNMDGGDSSVMTFNDSIYSRPSGGGRSLGDILFICDPDSAEETE